MSDDVPGAEAGGEAIAAPSKDELFQQMEAEQTAAEEGVTPETEEADPPVPQADTPPTEQLEPLSPEEYQKRHRDITAALRDERQEKRVMRDELAAIRAELAQFKTSQPQAFQQYAVDQRIAEYQQVNWPLWYAQDPDAAAQGEQEFNDLVARKTAIDNEQRQQAYLQQQQQQHAYQQQFLNTLGDQEQEYRERTPDYNNAIEHLKASLREEGEMQGFFGPQSDQYVTQQLFTIGQRVFASGQNLAEFAYRMAKQRGYQPPAPDIASIKAGAEAAKSISTLGPKTTAEGGSFEETMARLDGAAARDFWAKTKRQQFG